MAKKIIPNKQIVLTLVLFTSIQYTIAQLTNDEAATGIGTLCDEEFYLKKIAEHLRSKIVDRNRGLQEAALTASKYEIAAAAADSPEDQCLINALAVKAKQVLKLRQKQAEEPPNALLSGLEHSKEQRGVLLAEIENSKLAVTVKAGTLHGTNSAGTTMLQLETAHSNSADCSISQPDTDRTIANKQPDPAKATQLKLTALNALDKLKKVDKLTFTVASNGCTSSGGGTKTIGQAMAGCSWANGDTVSTSYKPSQYSIATTQTTPIYKEENGKKVCAAHAKQKGAGTTRGEKIADAICEALETKAEGHTMPELSGDTLAEDAVIQEAVASCTKKFTNLVKESDIATNSDLKTYLRTAYGKGTHGFDAKFKPLIKTKTVPVREGDNIKQKAIEKLTLDDDTHAVLARLLHQRLTVIQREPTSGIQTDAKDDAKVAECDGIADKTRCNGKDGCEFKEGKCKLEEGVKSENDEKTTNATGSNSFVIKKAPLLLAVLLLYLKYSQIFWFKFMKFPVFKKYTKS
ncbi:variant surface glycoprotein (VSG), putative [Trypanosoma brucei brucei TREU927]|uniref:Variant surface glycoprotein (VSG), putative n=2 Tax=Trypanosoma brucei TaxID=5691 RepID=Q22KU2_TRYB2|nr:variant surface glycoprotein [Trypanosoma brucei brucei TREU927]AGH60965.1 variant surface glycoprotein 390 [Trypanosoma brucei]EAN78988.1 variant surface glycoprotein (VSG), putative [Trypanosoma brucei brucei TREU927]